MKFVTPSGKETKTAEVRGYSIGHRTKRDGPNEKDLEGIVFTLDGTEANSIDEIEVSCDAGSYIDKFADWRDKIRVAIENGGDGEDLGLSHPETGEIVFIEEVPDYIHR